MELEAEAKLKQLGQYNTKVKPVTLGLQNFEGDAREFLNQNKGKQLDGIVEQVRDGSLLRVLLLDSMKVIVLGLGGIKAPVYRKDIPGVEDLIEPLGEEAKYFVESRLLQRQVKVCLEGDII